MPQALHIPLAGRQTRHYEMEGAEVREEIEQGPVEVRGNGAPPTCRMQLIAVLDILVSVAGRKRERLRDAAMSDCNELPDSNTDAQMSN